MNEASKTHKIRGDAFVQRYLQGRTVLDIGCGEDLVVPWAKAFDLADGDANQIASYFRAQSFDVVHSSHCLEHMREPHDALAQWWSLVKPGGYLITVVPDEELYEQGFWPSLFNGDHKWAFTFDDFRLWSTHVVDLKALHLQLEDAVLIDLQTHDAGYQHALYSTMREKPNHDDYLRYRRFLARLKAWKLGWLRVDMLGWEWLARHGIPVDQTKGDALAQLQIIVQKRPPSSGA
jgi:SAM-dependent methyltransferase